MPAPSRRHLTAKRLGDDTGSVSVQVALAWSTLFLIMCAGIQTALWYHARNVALAAAQEGLRVARSQHGSLEDGTQTARSFAATAGGGTLLNPNVSTAGSTATDVRITVTGQAQSFMLGDLAPTVSQQAAGPRERFTTGAP